MKEGTLVFAAPWPEPWPPPQQVRIHELPVENIVIRVGGRTDGRVVLERMTVDGTLVASAATAPIRLVRASGRTPYGPVPTGRSRNLQRRRRSKHDERAQERLKTGLRVACFHGRDAWLTRAQQLRELSLGQAACSATLAQLARQLNAQIDQVHLGIAETEELLNGRDTAAHLREAFALLRLVSRRHALRYRI